MPLAVLHAIPSLSLVHGGPSRAIRMMEAALRERGVDVLTVATDDDGPGRRVVRRCGVAVDEEGARRVYFAKRFEFYTTAPSFAVWAWRTVRRFDVVHVHALFSFMSVVAATVAWLRGVPFVLRPLGTLSAYGLAERRPWLKRVSLGLIERPLLRRASAVHCTSEAEAADVRALAAGANAVVIPLAVPEAADEGGGSVDADDVAAAVDGVVAASAFGDAPDGARVLFLSRLDPKKNVECLLAAWPSVRSAHPTARLVIAGTGEASYVASLRAAATVGGDAGVVWAGQVEGERKRALLAQASVFVLPSFNENFGIAAVEALAAGVPCVLSEGVAVARDVATAGAGLMVRAEPDAVADAIGRVLGDAPLRAAMAAAARRVARERFSPRAMGMRLQALYVGVQRDRHPCP